EMYRLGLTIPISLVLKFVKGNFLFGVVPTCLQPVTNFRWRGWSGRQFWAPHSKEILACSRFLLRFRLAIFLDPNRPQFYVVVVRKLVKPKVPGMFFYLPDGWVAMI